MDITSDMVRAILVIGGAAVGVFTIATLFVVFQAATEAREWFERENRQYYEDEP